MENHKWSEFTKRISINTDDYKIFDSLISQENLEKWFLSNAQFYNRHGEEKDQFSSIEKGDTYKWMWHGSDNIGEGEILENNRRDYIEFTFLESIVSMKVQEENGENVIELIQSKIPLDETSRINSYLGCSRGWTFYLTNLKSILEGGIDLRNRNKGLKDVINT